MSTDIYPKPPRVIYSDPDDFTPIIINTGNFQVGIGHDEKRKAVNLATKIKGGPLMDCIIRAKSQSLKAVRIKTEKSVSYFPNGREVK